MARNPGSVWQPLLEWDAQGTHVKDKFVVHSTGNVHDTAAGIYAFFNRPEVVVESTFVIGKTPADPTLQLLDSESIADANLGANATGISVEVCGGPDEPFTDWQVAELVRLGRWAMVAHPQILPRLCPSPTGAGFGWHVMWGAPSPWTPVAKVCPGDVRIAQLKSTVFPAIFGGTEEDLVTPEDVKAIATEVTRMIERNRSPLQRARQASEDSLEIVQGIEAALPKPAV